MVLSGALDDGTAGLYTIKQYGGIAIVQDPADAEVPSMPENALREVTSRSCVPVARIGRLAGKVIEKKTIKNNGVMKDEKTKTEIEIAAEENALKKGVLQLGELSPFACPECHGVLNRIQEGTLERYRCHTGHAYSVDTLLAAINRKN